MRRLQETLNCATRFETMPDRKEAPGCMSRPRILVINPNSNAVVTQGLEDALKPLDFAGGPEIVCADAGRGPSASRARPMSTASRCRCAGWSRATTARPPSSSPATAIPGLQVCREGTDRPVFGIAECGVLTALARAETFGVIAIAQRSIRRHMRYLRQMGLMDRLAGERPLNMSVAETASGEGTLAKMIEVGRALKRRGRRRRHRDGLRRHGAPSPAAGRRARHSRDRPDPGRRRPWRWARCSSRDH